MRSEELKTQSGAACGAAFISSRGYEEMLRLERESREEVRIFKELTEYLEDGKYPFSAQDKIFCLATEYGSAAEEKGFRRGFQTAMRLCMEGMKGDTC